MGGDINKAYSSYLVKTYSLRPTYKTLLQAYLACKNVLSCGTEGALKLFPTENCISTWSWMNFLTQEKLCICTYAAKTYRNQGDNCTIHTKGQKEYTCSDVKISHIHKKQLWCIKLVIWQNRQLAQPCTLSVHQVRTALRLACPSLLPKGNHYD